MDRAKYREFAGIYPARGWYARAHVHIEAANLFRSIMRAILKQYGLVMWNNRDRMPHFVDSDKENWVARRLK